MEYIVSDCSKCGGWCCKCITINKKVFEGENAYAPYDYWRQITLEEALILGPWHRSGFNPDEIVFFECERFKDGLCTDYENRPDTCSGYPNYDQNLEIFFDYPDAYYVPWCFYRMTVLEVLGIAYEVLEDGEQCQMKYLEKIIQNPETAKKFHNPDLLISKACQSSKDGIQGYRRTSQ